MHPLPAHRGDPPVPAVDYLRTCERPAWATLPHAVRAAVARVAGSPVAAAGPPVRSGFTGGFAGVLTLADGREVFAKAGSGVNPHLVQAYATEADVLAVLPAGTPAPALVGAAHLPPGEADDLPWQVLVTEAVRGRVPQPWTDADLSAVHSACLVVTEVLSAVAGRWTQRLGELFLDDPAVAGCYRHLADGALRLTCGQPRWVPHRLEELQRLVDDAGEALAGEVPGHGDLRADNVLVEGGRATLVDWNWVVLGPPWTDLVGVLPIARHDGVDVEAVLARSPLTRGVEPGRIDCWLAVVAAYMLQAAERPVWPGGPAAVRVHQRRYARLFLDWLAARRGWTQPSYPA